MIRRLLVANRGEIARRVFATCRDLGIETVAVYSDVDAPMPFVGEADHAVRLPGSSAADTYLRGEAIVAAALRSGADAVHPGYGFLSENAQFARAVLEAGLVWVGPTPESIEQMGSKVEAKALMAKAGVPVLTVPDEPSEADLPLLVKASAGGGGRGMRVVRSLADLGAEIAAASREAESTFGDATVFVEPYVERGRHVEVQVLGDPSGNVRVLGERDCSIQRRHQKVIEESPAPGLSDTTRTSLHDAARAAAEAIGYVGAGTVEFLVDGDRFWFLEMNTRLQVEHPVTEAALGLDLVALQLAVAEGTPISAEVSGLPRAGHAVEARLYAEDPAAGFAPQAGRLTMFDIPGSCAFAGPTSYGVRVDAGYRTGDDVSTHYDAMLAKVVGYGSTRENAVRRLVAALKGARIHGVRTNRDLLVAVLEHPDFLAGDVATDFLTRHDLTHAGPSAEALRLSAYAATAALAQAARRAQVVQPGVPVGWRNVVSQPHRTRFVDESFDVAWFGTRDGIRFEDESVTLVAADVEGVVLEVGGLTHRFEVAVVGDRVDVDSALGHAVLTRPPRLADPSAQAASGSLLAPMPGSVVSVAVAAGDRVERGRPVLVLEAMKMQHTVTAPHDGVVTDVLVTAGAQVTAGSVLAVVRPDEQMEEGEPR